jgi:hypothetical protein
LFLVEAMLVDLDSGKNQKRHDINGGNHRRDRQDKVDDEPRGFFSGFVLALEEIHGVES